jgi:hypothetical protein
MTGGRAPRPAMSLPAPLAGVEALEMTQYAREWLRAARGGENGDPFDNGVMHAMQRQMLKMIAAEGEPNCALVVRLAISETEDAHEALVDLFNERCARGEPIGMALATYYNMHTGAPRVRPPEGRQRNFVADYGIALLIIAIMAQFVGLKLRRNPVSKRPSACSVVAEALCKEGLGRGGEEAIRKIWERYGPPAIPGRPPQPGVVRFIFRDV